MYSFSNICSLFHRSRIILLNINAYAFLSCHDVSCHVSRICRNSSSGLAWGHLRVRAHVHVHTCNLFLQECVLLHRSFLTLPSPLDGGWLLVAGRWFCLHYVNVPVHNKPRMHHTVHYTVVTNQRIESIMICVWFHSSLLLHVHVHVLYIQQDLIRAKQPNHPINRY